ncbi:SUF system NifU family Fe-S cluster assembly protein [Fructobacillus sp. M1-13]|uniref:SUF system NifU family Fe-S cluster assembly protein n=1 Tax=Fructobacillus papyriferae TaxID=2713171 RepID=A0ABS5QPG3_9LACO|nr:SUF system NifU family Fe-S cluster assembly protein [Fructobacillus papyriferae]MBS9335064.1 SUF system NifU family Fe-S cluster assembly protein [Fructobacillus papyriferae]MCD2159450.1 SUF system NifU family Fe-S cluster assembly protein [Fructobacillus papyriferae]
MNQKEVSRQLYRQVMMDHARAPHHLHPLKKRANTFFAKKINQSCGDAYGVEVEIEKGRIRRLAFDGDGCAISMAASSMLFDQVQGKTIEEAESIIRRYFDAVVAVGCKQKPDVTGLGELEMIIHVGHYPSRVKCATLTGHALSDALAKARMDQSV